MSARALSLVLKEQIQKLFHQIIEFRKCAVERCLYKSKSFVVANISENFQNMIKRDINLLLMVMNTKFNLYICIETLFLYASNDL